MKKLLFILVLLGTVSGSYAQTNVYHPFPDKAYWLGEFWESSCSGFCYCVSTMIQGDTTIGIYNYKKTYGGAIRQDIPMKKVIYYDYTDHLEYILYDFNLALGDSIHHNQWYGTRASQATLIVTTIDSISLGGSYRKAFTLTSTNGEPPYRIAEGIGNLNAGPFTQLSPCFCAEYLKCFYAEGQLLLSWGSSWCSCSSSISEYENNHKANISISPNPFSTSTQISFDKTYPTIALSLYDLQGKLLLQNHYTDCNQITLHRNQLSNGLYFLKLIIDDKQIETRKIVITN